jgi:divalent metal cation (Fe/Co/Zn/Cd) transporter
MNGAIGKAPSSKTVVWIEFIAEAIVAIVKILAAAFTGSASMAEEGVHSVVDVGSGGLILYGYRRSEASRAIGRNISFTNLRPRD